MQFLINIHSWIQWAVLSVGLVAIGQQIHQIFPPQKHARIGNLLLLIFTRILEAQTALGGIIIIWRIFFEEADNRLLLHGLVGLLPIAILYWIKNQQSGWPNKSKSKFTLFAYVCVVVVIISAIFIIPEEEIFPEGPTFTGHQEAVRSLAFSPDGKLLASGAFDGTIRIWDVGSRSLVRSIAAHDDAIRSIAFSPDGKYIASVSFDQVLKVWSLTSEDFIFELEAHQASINKVLFSTTGSMLYTASLDNKIRLWDVTTGNLIKEIANDHQDGILGLALSEQAGLVSSGGVDGTIRVYDLEGQTTAYVGDHAGWVYDVDFSPDGSKLASCSLDELVKVWDLFDGSELIRLDDCQSPVQTIAYSHDGEFLAAGCANSAIKVWKTGSYKLISTITGHQKGVLTLAFSPSEDWLASGSADSTVMLWKVENP